MAMPTDQHERPTASVGDPDEFARLAAEVVALIEHHRRELEAVMAELTALQRTVRGEVRDAVAVLQRLAAVTGDGALGADGTTRS